MLKLLGPFSQILPMTNLPQKGSISDDQLEIIEKGGIVLEGEVIREVGSYSTLAEKYQSAEKISVPAESVAIPGLIDCHTHICFGGSRARDYSLRVAGKPYQEILKQGGGIYDSVNKTRAASETELVQGIVERANRHVNEGVTTIEVKSGYGLSISEELKMLRAIKEANKKTLADLIPTCLAAHVCPKEAESPVAWLNEVLLQLLPKIKEEQLSNRVDIFIEEEAFPAKIALPYLQKAKEAGFKITAHADQFSSKGSKVAVEVGALSADHLESSDAKGVELLANSDTVAVALPGASMGLGMQYTPARKLLDSGACLAIATDWNPGSAPMGDLLMQAAVLGAAEKLSVAETLAAITVRSARALGLSDRGSLEKGKIADILSFDTADYREILYYQGKMKPSQVWKKGIKVK